MAPLIECDSAALRHTTIAPPCMQWQSCIQRYIVFITFYLLHYCSSGRSVPEHPAEPSHLPPFAFGIRIAANIYVDIVRVRRIYIWHRSYRELPHFRVRMMPIGCRRNVVYHDRRVWPNVSLSRSHTNTFWWKIHCYQLSALHWAQRVWLRRVCVLSNCLRYSMRSNGGSMKHTMNTAHRVRIAKGVSLPSHTGSFALPLAHTFRFLVVVVFMPTPTHTHTHTPATMCIAALPPYIALAFNCTRYNLVNDDIKRVVGIYVFAVAQCAEAE